MQRKDYLKNVRRLVVKIGSSVLTDSKGRPAPPAFQSIVDQVMDLRKHGMESVVVSSGAIASGRAILRETAERTSIPEKQALAAVGQPELMAQYQKAIRKYGGRTAQVLLTRSDLMNRRRYLNARNTLLKLLQFDTLPVVNENDTVVVEEIKFGDNDNLSARVAILVEADVLVLLTDAPGLCDLEAKAEQAVCAIPFVAAITADIRKLARGAGGPLGTGGMATKLEAAHIATQAGIPAVIANGRDPNVLRDLLAGKEVGTFMAPAQDRLTHKKHWIAHTLQRKGRLVLDDGAVSALVHRGKSLLPSGILSVEGLFENGEMVSCVDRNGREWARGISQYSSVEVRKTAGRKSTQIESLLGYRLPDEVIHRDELVVLKAE